MPLLNGYFPRHPDYSQGSFDVGREEVTTGKKYGGMGTPRFCGTVMLAF